MPGHFFGGLTSSKKEPSSNKINGYRRFQLEAQHFLYLNVYQVLSQAGGLQIHHHLLLLVLLLVAAVSLFVTHCLLVEILVLSLVVDWLVGEPRDEMLRLISELLSLSSSVLFEQGDIIHDGMFESTLLCNILSYKKEGSVK